MSRFSGAGFFAPVYDKLGDRSRQQGLWNADETRWPVFQVVAGKVGNRWYVWLFESADCAVFTLDKGRAHDVTVSISPGRSSTFSRCRLRSSSTTAPW